jgi:hypothetical protein
MKSATLGPFSLAADIGEKPGELTLAGISLVAFGGEYGVRFSLLNLHLWVVVCFPNK